MAEKLSVLFETLPLFKLDAERVVRQHHACMYPLVPAMKNVNVDLMDQVMRELTELYRDDVVTLTQQFVWIQILLERTATIKSIEKEKIKGRLSMFEQLYEESPMIQKMREQYRVQGHQEGHQKGHREGLQEGRREGLQALQRSLVNVVQARYPDLAELAQQQAGHFDKPDVLERLIQQVLNAPDASTVRQLLEAGAEL